MGPAQIILIVDGLLTLALRLVDVAKQQGGDDDRLEALKRRLAETAKAVAEWRP